MKSTNESSSGQEKKTNDSNDENHQELVVMTYNVLAQVYVRSSFFPYCDSAALKWKNRSNLLEKEIGEIQPRPDVICLQECDQFNDFWEKMAERMGYQVTYLKKTRTKKDGLAILWRPEKLDMKIVKSIELNDISNDKEDSNEKERLLRDNVALIVKFSWVNSKNNNNEFLLATTHLFWDPSQADVKLSQATKILEELKLCNPQDKIPMILLGDFNSLPDSEVYSHITRECMMSSAYSTYQNNKSEPPFTNYAGSADHIFSGTLDYIFYNSSRLKPVHLRPLMSIEEASSSTALPNSTHGSDHLPLVCTFRFL